MTQKESVELYVYISMLRVVGITRIEKDEIQNQFHAQGVKLICFFFIHYE
jgi:hypothetical protein